MGSKKKKVAIIMLILLFLAFFIMKGKMIQPFDADIQGLAEWRIQREIFVVSLPESLIYDSTIEESQRIGAEIFANSEVYKIRVHQKKFTGDVSSELTVGVNKADKSTYVLPAEYNIMVSKDRVNIVDSDHALKTSETYVNFTSDSHLVTGSSGRMNQRYVISSYEDIPQSISSPVPEALIDVIKPPESKTVANNQFRVILYTWETKTGNVEHWEITAIFNGGIGTQKSILATGAGITE